MNPRPSTPTPRRFLTKRPASSQLPHSTPTPMRFQSTPRFGLTQSATRQIEDVEEVDVRVSQSQSSANEGPRSEGRDIALDSIEVDSCADALTSREERRSSSSSSSSEHEMDEDGEAGRPRGYVSDENQVEDDNVATNVHAGLIHRDDGTPPVKRRRLSASASPTGLHMVDAAYDSGTGHHDEQDDAEQDDEEDDDVQDKTRTRIPAQQPTFQPAPRFKPAPEDESFASGPAGTAAPFSPPRRRGAKYLADGFASQLQGLLSRVKRAEAGDDHDDDDNDGGGAEGAVARVLVEEVRLGARMHLVRGRVLSRGPAAAASDEVAQCYLLTGGGRGRGGARIVKEGSVLRIMPTPVWNVHLGEEWTVACDWSVESLES